MAHHKRGKPKSSRSGCLMCKPWKDQAFKDQIESQRMQICKQIDKFKSELKDE